MGTPSIVVTPGDLQYIHIHIYTYSALLYLNPLGTRYLEGTRKLVLACFEESVAVVCCFGPLVR